MKLSKKINLCINTLAIAIFVFGIILACIGKSVGVKASTIALCSLGIVMNLLLILVQIKLKVHFPLIFILLFTVFLVMALLFGDGLGFYKKFFWWDLVEHFISGIFLSIIGISILNHYDSNLLSKHLILLLIGSLIFSIAMSAVWEMVEYGMDVMFHMDTQKTIPPFSDIIKTNEILSNSLEEIGEFYQQPSGYRFAIFDTMEDMLIGLGGTIFFILIYSFLNHKLKGALIIKKSCYTLKMEYKK